LIHFTLGNGVQFFTQHPYDGLIYFRSGGADSRFNIGTYNFSRFGASGKNFPGYITNFTSDSATPKVAIVPWNILEGNGSPSSDNLSTGSQKGVSYPSLIDPSAHSNGGNRYACFDLQGNLVSSVSPCSNQ